MNADPSICQNPHRLSFRPLFIANRKGRASSEALPPETETALDSFSDLEDQPQAKLHYATSQRDPIIVGKFSAHDPGLLDACGR